MTSNPKASNAVDRYVGSRIRRRRVAIGMSQSRLAEALGLTFQQVQKYEKGVNRVGIARLMQISANLGVPTNFFFDGAPIIEVSERETHEGNQPSLPAQIFETQEGVALAEAFLRIEDPAVRRIVVDIVQHLAQQTQSKRPRIQQISNIQ